MFPLKKKKISNKDVTKSTIAKNYIVSQIYLNKSLLIKAYCEGLPWIRHCLVWSTSTRHCLIHRISGTSNKP